MEDENFWKAYFFEYYSDLKGESIQAENWKQYFILSYNVPSFDTSSKVEQLNIAKHSIQKLNSVCKFFFNFYFFFNFFLLI
jgi:hypothetical protein